MTPRYPGAFWLPTGGNGKMANGPDAGSLHIAVTRARSAFGWIQTAKACHGYNSNNGYMEQYMEFDDIAWGVADGNSHVLTIESYDGLLIHNDPNYWEEGIGGIYGTNADTGRWDDGQAERAADLIAWCSVSLGIQVTESHRAGDPGWGPHRLGVEPWRSDVYGAGEVWTMHNGKRCPGDARVAQIPSIVARAQVIKDAVLAGNCTWLPVGDVDVPSALARTSGTSVPPVVPPTTDWFDMATRDDLIAALKDPTVLDAYAAHVFSYKGLQKPDGVAAPLGIEFDLLRRNVQELRDDANNAAGQLAAIRASQTGLAAAVAATVKRATGK